jgi:hypothetical protein
LKCQKFKKERKEPAKKKLKKLKAKTKTSPEK